MAAACAGRMTPGQGAAHCGRQRCGVEGMRKILTIQSLLTLLVAGASYLQGGMPPAVAALYGGGIALGNSALLAWRVRRASLAAATSTERGTLHLYLGAVERFVFTLVAFGLGMGALKLSPLPMLIAFAAAQSGYWFAARGESMARNDASGRRPDSRNTNA